MLTEYDALVTALVSRAAAGEQQAADPSQPRFAHGEPTRLLFTMESDATSTAVMEVATLC